MSNHISNNKTRLAIAFGIAAAGGISTAALADNAGDLFQASSMNSGYMVDDARIQEEGKCGEGKCGEGEGEGKSEEGSCGEGKCGEGKCGEGEEEEGEGKSEEGKCGEGKCGA